ncbi:hypothetical protein BAUCODRAFT_145927 [Baudoinia panamericana UAMH 10762]|uniref:RING-type domain-containing protein n=1 Tax=Baudoinia panamericana (strain UAMH 10762) TaxID=717646 RepID=M2MQ76_BAUPA|nr:uncharacterized protein BAUCODRAFT_145927 [Baudoinia panamericana UAMH 10762]EMC98926.1 hypothetical protein BAUCODRAFT_145927 [Baudoinia panamericana UAMH 10762]
MAVEQLQSAERPSHVEGQARPSFVGAGVASAQSLQVVTFDFPNPDYTSSLPQTSHRINASISFTYLTSFNLRTLSSNAASPGDDVSGLLYVPDLDPTSACNNASAQYIPQNVTRRANLPNQNYYLIAIAPWLSPECVGEYFAAARQSPVRGFLTFLPEDTSSNIPPEVSSSVWGIGDGGSWKRQNAYPVYAIPGASARALLNASADYSGNMTSVPFGHTLTEIYDPRDYVRLFAAIDTSGASSLPSLWVFLLVVLGILMAIIGLTSFTMHFLQRRRRQALRRRVANGEVDLEALGIKRLTVPQEVLDGMPLYTYGSGAPVAAKEVAVADKLASASSSRPTSPTWTTRPSPAKRTGSFHPTALQQPTCAICLDDFVPASTTPEDREAEASIVRELPCHHIFHPDCVDTFLRDSSSLCPMCKKTVLPKGYCPQVVTNAMVRRERMIRRIRERVVLEPDVEDEGLPGRRGVRASRTFSGLPLLRGSRRVSSAPVQALTEMSPVPAPEASHVPADDGRARTPQGQPPSTPSRREWARQRAIAMLGRRTAPADPDAEERRSTPGWRKALRVVFPMASAR